MLGNCFNTSLMISSLLKGEERIKAILAFQDQELNQYDFYAESMANGEVRGFSLKQPNQIPVNQSPFLKVSKILYGKQEEQQSFMELDLIQNGNWIQFGGEQVQEFYEKSDQILNFCELETNNSGNQQKYSEFKRFCLHKFLVHTSFGYMLQKMPDAKIGYLEQLNQEVIHSKLFNQLKNERLNISGVKELFESLGITDLQLSRTPVDFHCRCCKDHFLKLLVNVGSAVLTDMRAKNERTLNCIYCNTNYTIEDADFHTLIEQASNKSADQTISPKP